MYADRLWIQSPGGAALLHVFTTVGMYPTSLRIDRKRNSKVSFSFGGFYFCRPDVDKLYSWVEDVDRIDKAHPCGEDGRGVQAGAINGKLISISHGKRRMDYVHREGMIIEA